MMNLDLAAVADGISAYVSEIQSSQSARTPAVSPGDETRINQYIASVKGLLADIAGRQPLDLPTLDPTMISLNPMPEETEMENPICTQVARYLRALFTEVTGSASASQVSGVSTPDATRFDAVVAALETFMSGYAANYNPVDAPDSGGSTGA